MEDMGQDAVPADRRRVISAINSLLDRHGVPERKRLVTLVTALGLDYNQIRRRMRGETPWNVDEIVRLADYYRESGLQLLAAFLAPPVSQLPCTSAPRSCLVASGRVQP